ncbi:MAG: hypothetical protein WC119_09770 [Synergistaceae bacterium]|nr:hypothetical protein [Candidatus Omnitrophota bacterium]
MRILASILVLLMLASASLAATSINQVDSKWSDIMENDTNMWTALTAWNIYNVTDNGKQMVLLNTTGSAGAKPINMTVHSGPFLQGALGDLKYYFMPINETVILGPLETSRFMQANGTILIEMNRTAAGKAIIVGVP